MPFSNGTMFDCFQHNVCTKCLHYELDEKSDTYGCPFTDALILYSYGAKGDFRDFIDFLCDGETCKLFKPSDCLPRTVKT